MPDFAIYAGDFNISLQQEKDTKHYIHENNPQATKALKEQMDIYGLIDSGGINIPTINSLLGDNLMVADKQGWTFPYLIFLVALC